MSYVNFNRQYTKAQIEALTNATNGKIYFATDGGIYVGNASGTVDKKADTDVVWVDYNADDDSANKGFTEIYQAYKTGKYVLLREYTGSQIDWQNVSHNVYILQSVEYYIDPNVEEYGCLYFCRCMGNNVNRLICNYSNYYDGDPELFWERDEYVLAQTNQLAWNYGDTAHAALKNSGSYAYGNYSVAEGYNTKTRGSYSHSEGNNTIAMTTGTHVEGSGSVSTVSGVSGAANATTYTTSSLHHLRVGDVICRISNPTSYSICSIVTDVPSNTSFVVNRTLYGSALSNASIYKFVGIAYGNYSHAEGYCTTASGSYSHAEGQNTIASDYSHSEGRETIAMGIGTHAEGYITTASGDYSHAEGKSTNAIGTASHAEGFSSNAYANVSHAEGASTTHGIYSHAEGVSTAQGNYSHAEGYNTNASGSASHAEGTASSSISSYTISGSAGATTFTTSAAHNLVVGNIIKYKAVCRKVVSVPSSTSFSLDSSLSSDSLSGVKISVLRGASYGEDSHTEGLNNFSINDYEHAEGKYNKSNTGSTDAEKTQHSVGIGTADNARANAFEIMQNGDAYLYGVGNYFGKLKRQTSSTDDKCSKPINNLIDPLVNIDWKTLVYYRDNSLLVPGKKYRICDYVTTVNSSSSRLKSDYHAFDIIVMALDYSHLSEYALAVNNRQSHFNSYFNSSNLSAWELKYSLSNDFSRFNWATNTVTEFIDPETKEVEEISAISGWFIDDNSIWQLSNDTFTYNGVTYYLWNSYTSNDDFHAQLLISTEYDDIVELTSNNASNATYADGIMLLDSDSFYFYSDLSKPYIINKWTSNNKKYIDIEHFELLRPTGVIYYMKDEYENEAPYDFKNIMLSHQQASDIMMEEYGASPDYYYLFSYYDSDTNEVTDASLEGAARRNIVKFNDQPGPSSILLCDSIAELELVDNEVVGYNNIVLGISDSCSNNKIYGTFNVILSSWFCDLKISSFCYINSLSDHIIITSSSNINIGYKNKYITVEPNNKYITTPDGSTGNNYYQNVVIKSGTNLTYTQKVIQDSNRNQNYLTIYQAPNTQVISI